jgi:hypothetical protein
VVKENDSNDVLHALVKSDRKAIESLAAIMRTNVDSCEKDFLRRVIIDLNRRTKKRSKHSQIGRCSS